MHKTQGLIAAGHHATAEAAAVVLEAGGNAFDAAVAALLASFVAEPCMSSAGGGAFLTAFRADGAAFTYDCFVQTPRNKRPAEEVEFFPVELDFGTAKETFYVGLGSVAVPGTIAGCWKIHRELGRLPLHVVAEPAIRLAKEGVQMDAFQYHDFCLLKPILELSKPSPVFWRGDRLIKEDEVLKMPEFADCLDHLVREGEDEFYKGEVAKMILGLNDAKGGHLTAEDLASYEVPRYEPLRVRYRDRTLLTNPLPSLGGSLIAIVLARLAAGGEVHASVGSPEYVSRLAEIFSVLDRMSKTPANLAAELHRWYPNLRMAAGSSSQKLNGTSHFSIIDGEGNAVAVTTSNGEGCGHFVPGTGIILNNMLGETALLPNGLHSWEPNVRLGSMMSPSILLDAENQAEAVLGSGGAGRIPFMLAQVIHQMVDYGMNIHDAVKFPRMHCNEGIMNLEPGLAREGQMPSEVERVLAWEKTSLFFGGVHGVQRIGARMEAEGDARRGGVTRTVG